MKLEQSPQTVHGKLIPNPCKHFPHCRLHPLTDIIPPNLLEPFLDQSVVIFIARFRYIDSPQKILQCDVLFARWKLVDGWRGIESDAPFARVGLVIEFRTFQQESENLVDCMLLNTWVRLVCEIQNIHLRQWV